MLAILWVLVFGANVSAATAPSSGATVALQNDPRRATRQIESWVRARPAARENVEPTDVARAIETGLNADPAGSNIDWERFDRALLTLVAGSAPRNSSTDAELRLLAIQGVRARLRGRGAPGFSAYLYDRALLMRDAFSTAERLGALLSLYQLYPERGRRALLALLKEPGLEPELESAALECLIGWEDASVSETLLEEARASDVERARRGRLHLREHLVTLDGKLDDREFASVFPEAMSRALSAAVLPDLVDSDWRRAARAIGLVRFCAAESATPRLIEALATWERRESITRDRHRELVGMRRVQHELANALEHLHGVAIGPKSHAWRTWWRSDDRSHVVASTARNEVGTVSAGFFGLQLESGAVAFVIDRSESMKAVLSERPSQGSVVAGSGESRYMTAIQQLEQALRSAARPTVFKVAVFSSDGDLWRNAVMPADEAHIKGAARWLRGKSPRGSTMLSTGIDELFPTDSDGKLDSKALDVDTVVILCDGATTEGPAWARNWLLRHQDQAELVFHCVQIGGRNAAALETLARSTGGSFRRIGE